MVDTKSLAQEMKNNGYTIEALATAMGLSRTGLFNKIHNRTEFRITEINKITILLNLKKREVNRIFFANDVELNSTNTTKED